MTNESGYANRRDSLPAKWAYDVQKTFHDFSISCVYLQNDSHMMCTFKAAPINYSNDACAFLIAGVHWSITLTYTEKNIRIPDERVCTRQIKNSIFRRRPVACEVSPRNRDWSGWDDRTQLTRANRVCTQNDMMNICKYNICKVIYF